MALKQQISVLAFLFGFINLSFAQSEFKDGFVIDNNGNKTLCKIQEEDWKNNPTNFSYKLDGSNDILIGNLNDFKAFGVDNEFKYIKKETFTNKESLNKPVFLSVLLEGQVSI